MKMEKKLDSIDFRGYLKKYDINCNDVDTLKEYCDELNIEFEKNNEVIDHFYWRKKLYLKYYELRKAWVNKHIRPALWAISVISVVICCVGLIGLFLSVSSGQCSLTTFSKVVILTMVPTTLSILIIGSIVDGRKNPVNITDDEINRADRASNENHVIVPYLVYFNERLKRLITLHKYENAYAVLESIAKEQNCSIDDLYLKYTIKEAENWSKEL